MAYNTFTGGETAAGKEKIMDRNKAIKIALVVLGIAALVMGGIVGGYFLWEKAPEPNAAAMAVTGNGSGEAQAEPVSGVGEQEENQASPVPSEEPEEELEIPERPEGIYTLLLVGNDEGNGNTDTIMVARLDTARHELNVLSIPRDTLINVDWTVRKINTVYWGTRNAGGDGMDALEMHIARLMGFRTDFYAMMDLDTLIEAVDTVGGVWFDVPVPMDFDDWDKELYIHLQPGYQHLDGAQTMGVLRFRSGYISGDLGRIDMQHQFLQAVAEQMIQLGNIPHLPKLARLLAQGLETDLDAPNIAWLLRQVLACDPEDIHFYTLPCTVDSLYGYSYVVLDLWNWLDLLNERFNPYDKQIYSSDLDVVYKQGGEYFGTRELRGDYYYKPVPTPEPTPEPEDTGEGRPAIVVTDPEESPDPEGTPAVVEGP